ncbi:MAG TPA: UDP-3-O-(3-hydroxymyristoyl)glucosamine N-acyltransferase [Gemmatimonadaceae bacterium]|nr:UDP-3-O-(3-hydroxymyristoyl)glucosamine N-acyltransferase [Gemmatimonadaceae bacterium]
MTVGPPEHAIVGGGAQRSHTADDLASAIDGRVIGDGGAAVSAIVPLDRAGPSDIAFLARAEYAPLLAASRAGIVIVSPELAETPGTPRARIVVAKPYEALLELIPRFHAPPGRQPGIDPQARIGHGVLLGRDAAVGPGTVIGDGARIGDRVTIGAHVAIGPGVEIGHDTLLHPHVTLYPGTSLGRRVIVHAGVRLGSDGFGYVWRDGEHRKIPHVGRCIIADDVEIGANSTIDRGSIDDTVIGAGTKIDNLVHVGHNVRIGRLCLLMAQVGIAGSARLEDGSIVAGQAGIGGHVTIGAGARIGGQAGVFGDVPPGESWSGYPARPHKESLRAHAALFRLAPLMRRLEQLLGRESR